MIVGINEVNLIDIMDIMNETIDSLPKSNDGSRVIVKWEREDVPPSIDALETKEGPYTQSQINSILAGSDWK